MRDRYIRQTQFAPIGREGQQRISAASIAIIGCGALGAANAEMLARAGVGHLILVDRDVVELSNLQRQSLYTEAHAGQTMPKVVAAEQRLLEIRSDLQLTTYMADADRHLLEKLATTCDLFVDGTDNFETRLLLNDAAYKHAVPWVHGACIGSTSMVFPFVPGKTSCFRCLMPVLPKRNATCETVGVISPAVQITAALQTAEALKLLSGKASSLRTKINMMDVWENESIEIGLNHVNNVNCETCGEHPAYPSLHRYEPNRYTLLCGRQTIQVMPDPSRTFTLDDAEQAALRLGCKGRRTPYFVEMTLQGYRIVFFHDGRLLIHDLDDLHVAKKLHRTLFG